MDKRGRRRKREADITGSAYAVAASRHYRMCRRMAAVRLRTRDVSGGSARSSRRSPLARGASPKPSSSPFRRATGQGPHHARDGEETSPAGQVSCRRPAKPAHIEVSLGITHYSVR